MSHLPSNYKILIFALLIALASCSKAVKPSAEKTAPRRKDGSQDFRIPVRSGRGVAGGRSVRRSVRCARDLRPGWRGNPVHGRCGAGWGQSAGFR